MRIGDIEPPGDEWNGMGWDGQNRSFWGSETGSRKKSKLGSTLFYLFFRGEGGSGGVGEGFGGSDEGRGFGMAHGDGNAGCLNLLNRGIYYAVEPRYIYAVEGVYTC